VSLKAGLEDWEINFIQGMVNQFQIDFRTSKPGSKNKGNQMRTSYRMMEVKCLLSGLPLFTHPILSVPEVEDLKPIIFYRNITLVPVFSETRLMTYHLTCQMYSSPQVIRLSGYSARDRHLLP
jgi:hypothetical protein